MSREQWSDSLARSRKEGLRVWGWTLKKNIETFVRESVMLRIPMSEANMGFRRAVGMRLFPDADNTVRLNNGYLVILREPFDTQSSAAQIRRLHDFCSGQNLPFLYVMAVRKLDSRGLQLPNGLQDHGRRNIERFLGDLAQQQVPVLDLHDVASTFSPNHYDMFFRTDHHWTPEAGLWAARWVADDLNRRYDLDMPVNLLDPLHYESRSFEKMFLGSLGRKLTRAYVDMEVFSLITPRFETRLRLEIPAKHFDRTGSFREVLIDDAFLAAAKNPYEADVYGAYLQGDNPLLRITNHLRPEGARLLVIKDSFANVVVTFLAMAAY